MYLTRVRPIQTGKLSENLYALKTGTVNFFIYQNGFVLILARRAVLEERTLRQELPGYAVYMEKVKYRLIPYFW